MALLQASGLDARPSLISLHRADFLCRRRKTPPVAGWGRALGAPGTYYHLRECKVFSPKVCLKKETCFMDERDQAPGTVSFPESQITLPRGSPGPRLRSKDTIVHANHVNSSESSPSRSSSDMDQLSPIRSHLSLSDCLSVPL